ncbi:NnrS family protein [Chitinivorax sp. PXF-14]|uniref:NnrS family protein n=1 Tax=Chitinivorax sp. PXF-14 TaxID=3230488 RepID=UPI0034678F0F
MSSSKSIEPHRVFFFSGVLASCILLLWWSSSLLFGGQAHPAVPPVMAHALLMLLGVFPPFMLGFIFTAGPRWLAVQPPEGYLLAGGAYFGGTLLALIGLTEAPWLAAAGFALMAFAWFLVTWRWQRLIVRSTQADKRHARYLLMAMLLGIGAMLAALVWVASGDAGWWLASRELVLWGFLLPVFLTVAHRMIPFFSGNIIKPYQMWRPDWLLDVWIAGSLLLGALEWLGWHAVQAPLAFALAGLFGYTSVRWGVVKSLDNRLLAMLHLAFAWLAPAMVLLGLGGLGVAVGAAPVHALGLGMFMTMLVGFVTRVTLGHSGRPLAADNVAWAIYCGLHGVALMRVLAALIGNTALLHAASALWLVLMLLWAARVLPMYIRPKAPGAAS